MLSSTPADALAAYFAIEHDPRRTKLHARQDARGRVLAFVAVCQTGIDLFRPFVVVRGDDSSAVRELLREALTPGRQYLFSVPATLRMDLEAACAVNSLEQNRIYALSADDFRPVMNMLVQTSRSPDGLVRAVIWAKDNVPAAEAGTSWISSRHAELFVRVELSVRRRGLGRSVVSAAAQQVLALRRTPLYMTSFDNVASQRLAESLGFHDSGATELSGNLMRRA